MKKEPSQQLYPALEPARTYRKRYVTNVFILMRLIRDASNDGDERPNSTQEFGWRDAI